MTYNFDAEAWYERERALLDGRRAAGELDDAAYEAELTALDERYEAMLSRLDGSFRIPC